MNRYLQSVKSLITYLASVDDALNYLRNISAWLDTFENRYRALVKMLSKPSPFVSILIEGNDKFGVPIWLGQAKYLIEKRDGEFWFQPNLPLHNVRVCVFTDLRLVRIEGIFCGQDLMQGALGSCPIAYIEKIELGTNIRVICSPITQ